MIKKTHLGTFKQATVGPPQLKRPRWLLMAIHHRQGCFLLRQVKAGSNQGVFPLRQVILPERLLLNTMSLPRWLLIQRPLPWKQWGQHHNNNNNNDDNALTKLSLLSTTGHHCHYPSSNMKRKGTGFPLTIHWLNLWDRSEEILKTRNHTRKHSEACKQESVANTQPHPVADTQCRPFVMCLPPFQQMFSWAEIPIVGQCWSQRKEIEMNRDVPVTTIGGLSRKISYTNALNLSRPAVEPGLLHSS